LIRSTLILMTVMSAGLACAQSDQSPLTQSMGITQRLGQFVPKDATFKDEANNTVKMGDFLGKRPIVIVPVFFACQTGCALITDNVLKTIVKAEHENQLVVGRDLDIVMLSIHPKETPALAHDKKALIMRALELPNTAGGWHLLTGNLKSIHEVTDAIGFKYKYDEKKNLINHPMGSVIVSPAGKISAYTIGNDWPTKVIEDNLAYAKNEETAPLADQSLMFGCIMLDPESTKYRPLIENIIRGFGALTLAIVSFSIYSMSVRYKYRRDPLQDLGKLTGGTPGA
jgi:protein SCO1